MFIPAEFRGPYRAILVFALEAILRNAGQDAAAEIRAWKLWLLLPRLLLRHHKSGGDAGGSQREVLHERLKRFWDGQWDLLLRD
eukprot:9441894-Karenia_brevis.AAC.1